VRHVLGVLFVCTKRATRCDTRDCTRKGHESTSAAGCVVWCSSSRWQVFIIWCCSFKWRIWFTVSFSLQLD